MPDVYLIAIIVSIIKMHKIATIEYNIGFFCFILLVLMTRATTSALDSECFWQELDKLKSVASPNNNDSSK
jgi:paraquat-inducible protein A